MFGRHPFERRAKRGVEEALPFSGDSLPPGGVLPFSACVEKPDMERRRAQGELNGVAPEITGDLGLCRKVQARVRVGRAHDTALLNAEELLEMLSKPWKPG